MRFVINGLKIILAAACLTFCAMPALAQDSATINPDIKKLEKNLVEGGRFYFASKKYESAIQQWTTALSLNPENKAIERYIAEARSKLKQEGEITYTPDVKLRKVTPGKNEVKGTGVPEVREIIGILSLNDCINIAVKNHIPLQIAEKSIKLAEMRLWEARRNMLPTIGVRYEEYSGRVQSREYVGRKQYLEGQQPVYHGGELYYTMKQADVNLEVVKNDYARIRNELVLQVKKGYYTLLKAKENLKLQANLSAEASKIFDMVKKQYEANILPKLELLNVSSQLSQIKFQLVSADGDESVADLILKQAMNIDLKQSIDIQPRFGFKKIEADFEKMLALAMMNRAEMKINSLMITYYKYEKSIARAKGMIKVDLMGNWGLAKEEFDAEDRLGPTNGAGGTTFDIDEKMQQQWYAGFKASMPIWGSTGEYSWTKEQFVPVVASFQGTEAVTQSYKFDFLNNLKYYSDKQSADLDFDRARQELTKIKQDITLEVQESCFNYAKALIQLDTSTSKVEYQKTDLELNKLRREVDEVPDSSVIDSMIKLAQEEFGHTQALTDCYIAIASLNKAVGVENYFEADSETKDEPGK